MAGRFHVTDTKYKEYREDGINRALSEKRITKTEAELLKSFVADIKANSKSFFTGRAYKITYILIGSRRFLKQPFNKATFENIQDAVTQIKESEEYTKNTKSDYIRLLKRFCLWMVDHGHSVLSEKDLRKIQSPGIDPLTKTAEMMLTRQEVEDLIRQCRTSRDRAFFMMHRKTGADIRKEEEVAGYW